MTESFEDQTWSLPLDDERGPCGWHADESLLIITAERRRRPPGGIRVLLAGGSESELFLLRFVVSELPQIRLIGSAAGLADAVEIANLRAPDLVLVDHALEARALCGALTEGKVRPLLVLLTDRTGSGAGVWAGAVDAQMQKPVSHDRCLELVERLFPG